MGSPWHADGGEAPAIGCASRENKPRRLIDAAVTPSNSRVMQSTNDSDYLIRVAHTVLTCDEDSRAWRMQMPDRMARPERFELPTLRFEA